MDSESQLNNRRIAKNTILLYVRMLLTMAVALYTSRVVLQVIGVTDFGIYNVVGGIVMMLSFLKGAMTTSIQRYLTFYLGKANLQDLRKVFNISVQILAIISFVIVLIAETVGIWFMNTQMIIPADRFYAAQWVFQLSIITMVLQVMSIPYNAAIVAHERMGAFAYISIAEVLLKLIIVYLLLLTSFDKLIVYAVLIAIVQFFIRYIYNHYCYIHFEESHLQRIWDVRLLKEIGSFAGWNIWGNLAASLFGQGLNLLLNVFFGPVVNAARGISLQVEGALSQLSSNFMMAVNPQITKTYATNQMEDMHRLVFRSSKFSYFLIFIFSLPVIWETDAILVLWLKTPPEYTGVFVKLILCATLVNTTSLPIQTAAAATGDVKLYQSVIGGILLLVVPVSYMVLKFGGDPVSVYVVYFAIIVLSSVVRLFIVKSLISLSVIQYCKNVICPILLVTVSASFFTIAFSYCHSHTLTDSIINMFAGFIVAAFFSYLLGLDKSERQFLNDKMTVAFQKLVR